MPGRVEGKIAIVTGASNGIGREISLLLAKEGATVICGDLSDDARGATPTHEVIKAAGGKAIFQKVNTASEADNIALVEAAVQQFGRLDIMVNNAGISGVIPAYADRQPAVWELEEANFSGVLEINTKGVFLGCKHASKVMKDQEPGETGDRGWIVNTASIMGLIAIPSALAYVTSKHAVIGITKVAALDCSPHRIHVNAICPGYIATDLIKGATGKILDEINTRHPFGGVGKATDIAKGVLFLASPDNTYMTGANLVVDGGYTAL